MEVYKNRDSGKYFIFLQDCGHGAVLLVTPEAKVKPLRATLFDEVEDFSEEYLREKSFVNEDQISNYKKYLQNRSDDLIDGCIIDFENMTPHQQREVIRRLQEKAATM